MEDQLGLQGEENLKMSQQAQDHSPYDPNAAVRFPDGYTPVGGVSITTLVEDAPSINVGEVEVTASIDFSNPVLESFGSSGDNVVLRNITPAEAFKAYGIDITPVGKNDISFNSDTIPFGRGNNVDNSIVVDDLPEQEQVVDPPVPPVDPPLPPIDPPVDPPVDPEDPEEPDPEDPEEPDPEDPEDPEEPDPEDPEDPEEPDPEDPEEPDPEDPEDPEDPDPEDPDNDHPNNGFGNGDQDAPGNSGPNNNAENDQTPGKQGNSHENDSDNGGGGGKPKNHQDNGWGNGDDDAPGNSKPHNNAENDQTPSGHYDNFISRFIEENPVDVDDINIHEIPNEHPFDNFDINIPDVILVDNLSDVYFDHSEHHIDY